MLAARGDVTGLTDGCGGSVLRRFGLLLERAPAVAGVGDLRARAQGARVFLAHAVRPTGRIHFVLINDAYKAANPDKKDLHGWLDAQLATFDKIYGGKRPRYLEGYDKLKEAIKPWGK